MKLFVHSSLPCRFFTPPLDTGGILSIQKCFTYILYLNQHRKVARSYKQYVFLNILVKAAISAKLLKWELVAIFDVL